MSKGYNKTWGGSSKSGVSRSNGQQIQGTIFVGSKLVRGKR